MKSNIPLYILSIRRNSGGANRTLNHLKKYFSNVKIFYGLDIKSKENVDNIKSPQVINYNIIDMIKRYNITKPFLFAEDDLRITRPKQLLEYLKGGIKGENINRLIYASSKASGIGGTMLVGINKPQQLLNKLETTRLMHFDKWLDKHYPNQTLSPNFGINIVDRASFLDWGTSNRLKMQTEAFKRGERETIPIAFKRSRDYR